MEFGQNPARKAALLIGEECPGPGAKLHGHAIPPPAPVKAKLKIRKRGLPFWEMGLKIQVQVLKTWLCLDEGTGASGGEGGGGGRTKSNAAMLLFMPPVPPPEAGQTALPEIRLGRPISGPEAPLIKSPYVLDRRSQAACPETPPFQN